MIKPHARRSLLFSVAVLTVQAALSGCHKDAGKSGDAQPPARAGSSTQVGSPMHADTSTQGPRSIRLVPNGGVGFDDLVYSADSHAVLAPAGATGCVDLFDSASLAKTQRCGLSASEGYAGGHGAGVTSADVGAGRLFAIDRTSQNLKVTELASQQAAHAYPLSGQPDYVRWVEGTREIWITEPDQEQIEVFALGNSGILTRTDAIAVKGGPESLVVDRTRGRAYCHLWAGGTVAIDLVGHRLVQQFSNGCKGSRGIALNSARGFLFAGCSEGKVVVLDLTHAGRALAAAETPSGVDIIALNLDLNHLYVPAASDGSVTVFGVRGDGALSRLGSFSAAQGAHCVASDDHARVWVCSPDEGGLLVFDDTFAPTLE
ncbi:MAG TPA: hypothetical protein VHM25_13535 [Polyangiaceae bacterium]|jgi:hypothetical protein|nr:hypothetical protein [Polyangiaceae bacterium]